MKKFTFYKDEKITIWERTAFIVEAKSQEEAEKLAKKAVYQDIEYVGKFDGCEILLDTKSYYDLSPTDMNPTIEIRDEQENVLADDRLN